MHWTVASRSASPARMLLQVAFGYVMFPVAYMIGVTADIEETMEVARLMATKTAVNEFVAYRKLGELLSSEPRRISVRRMPRSKPLETFS